MIATVVLKFQLNKHTSSDSTGNLHPEYRPSQQQKFRCARYKISSVCADMFILGDVVDIATLDAIPRFTGG